MRVRLFPSFLAYEVYKARRVTEVILGIVSYFKHSNVRRTARCTPFPVLAVRMPKKRRTTALIPSQPFLKVTPIYGVFMSESSVRSIRQATPHCQSYSFFFFSFHIFFIVLALTNVSYARRGSIPDDSVWGGVMHVAISLCWLGLVLLPPNLLRTLSRPSLRSTHAIAAIRVQRRLSAPGPHP